jgi:hypothetical protein
MITDTASFRPKYQRGPSQPTTFLYAFSYSRNLRVASWSWLSSPPLNRGFPGRLEETVPKLLDVGVKIGHGTVTAAIAPFQFIGLNLLAVRDCRWIL